MARGSYSGQKPRFNLDWTRVPPPPCTTTYQHFVRSIDWSCTALGPMSKWGRELRQAVLMAMAEVKPVILYWGDEDTMIYNEAYAPFVGSQHPNNMGKSAPVIFPLFWDFFDNAITEMRQTGETRAGEALMIPMTRKGFIEETYFDSMLVPVIGDDGQMHGAYGRPTESTLQVFQKRRNTCIQNLSQRLQAVRSLPELWENVIEGLSINEKDVPLAAIYSAEQSPPLTDSVYTLRGSIYMGNDRAIAPLIDGDSAFAKILSLASQDAHMKEVSSSSKWHSDLSTHFEGVGWKGFGTAGEEYAIIPIGTAIPNPAILIIGLNPRCRLDDNYRKFLRAIADILSSQYTRLQLALEVQKRAADARAASLEFQRSESKFSRFAERSPVGLALTDPHGKVQFANDAWLNFTGLNTADVDISNWITTVYEEDVPMVHGVWERFQKTKKGETFQVRSKVPFEGKDMRSSYRTAMCAIYPDLDEKGDVTTVMGLVLDISEQKWVEEQLVLRQKELEKSETRYRTFAERSTHGVVCTDEHGYVTFANDAWLNMYGFERGKVVDPEPWLAHLVEEDREAARQYFRTVKSVDGPHTIEIRQMTRINKAGEIESQTNELWLLATGWAEYRPDGSINAVVFWVTDITAQKLAARVLEEKMEEAIRLKTQQERFIDMISHEIRNPLSAILHCGEDIVDSMKKCLKSIKSDITADDIVQSSIRTQISSALESATTVMYCVQHQKQIVDDVLTLSKLDSDLLVVTSIPVQPRELLDSVLRIFDSETRSSDIRMRIEKAASIEAMGIDWIMLDPNRFLQIVINLVTNAVKFTRNSTVREITISVSARNERPPAEHDGVKYVPQSTSSKKRADASETPQSENTSDDLYLCFSVTDTGMGLTEKESRTLFNRFTQASPKTHTEYGGSGLGLFISRQITEMLGGEIGVGPAPGGGCKFAFYVKTCKVSPPRRPSDQPTAALHSGMTLPSGTSINSDKSGREKSRRKQSVGAQLGHRVLVVEDNLINQRVLCKQLRNHGYEVEAANHGKEALDALHLKTDGISNGSVQPRFDVILCDIEMPVMDGIECVTEIRRQERQGVLAGHVPIIGVTANVRSKQVSTAIEVGMDGVTTKPYRMNELIAHINRVCSNNDSSRPQSPIVRNS